MFTFIKHQKGSFLFSATSRLVVFVLSFSLIFGPSAAQAQSILNLPIPGTMIAPSPAFAPVLLKGMTIHLDDPLKFDFIIDSGNTDFTEDEIKKESEKLVKYFLASMTIPKDDLWVNLSPYEEDRIIPDKLGKTELGRDMLAQDYILKQLTASLMYPEDELGKKFWDRVYQRAEEEFGTSEIPVNTFNKVWILPETASVYEHEQTVYIVDAHLKVMLDFDYVAMEAQQDNTATPYAPVEGAAMENNSVEAQNFVPVQNSLSVSSQIIKEIIIPEIEREVNKGAHFAPLRQIYHSLILAKWYKETIKNSLLSQIYVDKNLTDGVDVEDKQIKDKIYAQYMEAYKKGVFNYIKEDYDRLSNKVIPRKYFSGGLKIGVGDIRRSSSPVIGDGFDGKGYKASVAVTPQIDGISSPIKGSDQSEDGDQTMRSTKGLRDDLEQWHAANKYYMSMYLDPSLLEVFKKAAPLIVQHANNESLSFKDFMDALQNPSQGILEKIGNRKIERYYMYDFMSYLMATTDIEVVEEDRNYLKSAEKIFTYIMDSKDEKSFIRNVNSLRTIDKFKAILILKWVANAAEIDDSTDTRREVARTFLKTFLSVFFDDDGFKGKTLLDVYSNIVENRVAEIKSGNEGIKNDEILIVPLLTSGGEIGNYVKNKISHLGIRFQSLIFTTVMSVKFGRESRDDGLFDKSASFTPQRRQSVMKYLREQGIIDGKIKHVIFIDTGSSGSFGKLFTDVLSGANMKLSLLLLSHEGYDQLGIDKNFGYGVNDFLNSVHDYVDKRADLEWHSVIFEDGFEHPIEVPDYNVNFNESGSVSIRVTPTPRQWYANLFSEKIEELSLQASVNVASSKVQEDFISSLSNFKNDSEIIRAKSKKLLLTNRERGFLAPQYGSIEEFWSSGWRDEHKDNVVVYLIRHMESISNVLGVTQNLYNFSPGTPHGYRQAEAMARFLKSVPIDKFVSSDAERAYTTLEHLWKIQGHEGPMPFDPRIAEILLFPVGGISQEVAFEVFDPNRLLLSYPMDFKNIHLESIRESYEDVSDFYRELEMSTNKGETVAIGTHGGSIRAQLMSAGHILPEKMFEVENFLYPSGFDYSNAGISVLTFNSDQKDWEVLVFKDSSYLPIKLRSGTPEQELGDLKAQYRELAKQRHEEFVANNSRLHKIHRDYYPQAGESWEWNIRIPSVGEVKAWYEKFSDEHPFREEERMRDVVAVQLLDKIGLKLYGDRQNGQVTYSDDFKPLDLGNMRLIVVPHGLTDFNEAHGIQDGNADGEDRFYLNGTGKAQAAEGAQELVDIVGDDDIVLISSFLKRAQQTADPYLKATNRSYGDLQEREFVREINSGLWSGLTTEQIKAQLSEEEYEKLNQIEHQSNLLIAPKGGESVLEYLERVREGMQNIIEDNQGKTVVIYTHGGFVRALKILLKVGQEHNLPFIDLSDLRILSDSRGYPIIVNDLIKEEEKDEIKIVKRLYSAFNSDAFPYLNSANLDYLLGLTYFPYHISQLKASKRKFNPKESIPFMRDDLMQKVNYLVALLEEKLEKMIFVSESNKRVYLGVLLALYLETLEDADVIKRAVSEYWEGDSAEFLSKVFDLISKPLGSKLSELAGFVSGSQKESVSIYDLNRIIIEIEKQGKMYGEYDYSPDLRAKELSTTKYENSVYYLNGVQHHSYIGIEGFGEEIVGVINDFKDIREAQENKNVELIIFGGAIRDFLISKLKGRSPPKVKDIDMFIATELTDEEKIMTDKQLQESLETRMKVYTQHFKKPPNNNVDLLGIWIESTGKIYPVSSEKGDEYRSVFSLIPEVSINRIGVYSNGLVFDPSNGIEDLRSRTLRLVTGLGEAPHLSMNIFAVLRYIRFIFSFPDYSPDKNSLRMLEKFLSTKGHFKNNRLMWSSIKLSENWIRFRLRVLLGEIFSHAIDPDSVVKYFKKIGMEKIFKNYGIEKKTIMQLSERRKKKLLELKGLHNPSFLSQTIFPERVYEGIEFLRQYIPTATGPEVWLLSTHAQGVSEVETSTKRVSIVDLLSELNGRHNAWADHIVKIIAAGETLPPQHHPSDFMAQSIAIKNGTLEPQGKTESWVVLDVDPTVDNPVIYLGFNPDVTRKDFESVVRESRILDEAGKDRANRKLLEDYLAPYPVKVGDIIHVPPGIVHAIGKGLLILEVQTKSDNTIDYVDREFHGEDSDIFDTIDWEANMSADSVERNIVRTASKLSIPRGLTYNISKLNIHSGQQIYNRRVSDGGELLISFKKRGQSTKIKTGDQIYELNKLVDAVFIPHDVDNYEIIPDHDSMNIVVSLSEKSENGEYFKITENNRYDDIVIVFPKGLNYVGLGDHLIWWQVIGWLRKKLPDVNIHLFTDYEDLAKVNFSTDSLVRVHPLTEEVIDSMGNINNERTLVILNDIDAQYDKDFHGIFDHTSILETKAKKGTRMNTKVFTTLTEGIGDRRKTRNLKQSQDYNYAFYSKVDADVEFRPYVNIASWSRNLGIVDQSNNLWELQKAKPISVNPTFFLNQYSSNILGNKSLDQIFWRDLIVALFKEYPSTTIYLGEGMGDEYSKRHTEQIIEMASGELAQNQTDRILVKQHETINKFIPWLKSIPVVITVEGFIGHLRFIGIDQVLPTIILANADTSYPWEPPHEDYTFMKPVLGNEIRVEDVIKRIRKFDSVEKDQSTISNRLSSSPVIPNVDGKKYYMSMYADESLKLAIDVIAEDVRAFVSKKEGNNSKDKIMRFVQNPEGDVLKKMNNRKIEGYYIYDLMNYLGIKLNDEDRKFVDGIEALFSRIMNIREDDIDDLINDIRNNETLENLSMVKTVFLLKWLGNMAEITDDRMREQRDKARIFLEKFIDRFFNEQGAKEILDQFSNLVRRSIKKVQDEKGYSDEEIVVVPLLTSGQEIGDYVKNKIKDLKVQVKPLLYTTAMSFKFGRKRSDTKFNSLSVEGKKRTIEYLEQKNEMDGGAQYIQQQIISDNVKHIIFLDPGWTGSFGKLFSEVFEEEEVDVTSELLLVSHGGYTEEHMEWAVGLNEYLHKNTDWVNIILDEGLEHQIEIPKYEVTINEGSVNVEVKNSPRKWFSELVKRKIQEYSTSVETVTYENAGLSNEFPESVTATILNLSDQRLVFRGWDKRSSDPFTAEEKRIFKEDDDQVETSFHLTDDKIKSYRHKFHDRQSGEVEVEAIVTDNKGKRHYYKLTGVDTTELDNIKNTRPTLEELRHSDSQFQVTAANQGDLVGNFTVLPNNDNDGWRLYAATNESWQDKNHRSLIQKKSGELQIGFIRLEGSQNNIDKIYFRQGLKNNDSIIEELLKPNEIDFIFIAYTLGWEGAEVKELLEEDYAATSDLRHVFRMPFIDVIHVKEPYKGSLFHKQIAQNAEILSRVFSGKVVDLELTYNNLDLLSVEGDFRKLMKENGYKEIQDGNVNVPGEYFIKGKRISIIFLPARYPVNTLVVSDDGKNSAFVLVPGSSGRLGANYWTFFDWVKEQMQGQFSWTPAAVFVLDNGVDPQILQRGKEEPIAKGPIKGDARKHYNAAFSIVKSDSAMLSSSSPVSDDDEVGGIDLNEIDVDRQGAGVDIQFDPLDIQAMIDMGITGFAPVIINLVPLPSVLPLLGLAPRKEDEEFELLSLN